MLMIIYLIAAMILTPIAVEFLNKKFTDSGRVTLMLRGLPVYTTVLVVCFLEALLGLVIIPSEYNLSLWNVLIFTALIYLGNQIVFNFAVKMYSKARSAVQHGGAVQ